MPDTKGYILYDNFLAKTELQELGKRNFPNQQEEGKKKTTPLLFRFIFQKLHTLVPFNLP